MRRRWPAALRPFAYLLAIIATPYVKARAAWKYSGAMSRTCHGLGTTRLGTALRLFWLTLRHNLSADEVLVFQLWRSERIWDWLIEIETISLQTQLTDHEAFKLAGDKEAFADWCAQNSLPAVPTLAGFAAGGSDGRIGSLPGEVVVKPLGSNRAQGIELVAISDENGAADLAERWAEQSLTMGAIIVQPRLLPHPELQDLTAVAASVVRVISARWPDSRAEVAKAFLTLHPHGDFVADPAKRINRLIDLDTGVTLSCPSKNVPEWRGPSSPDGRRIPYWRETVDIVLKAHRLFPGRNALLGWDVAITPDGPVLIETNNSMGFRAPQVCSLQPAAPGVIENCIDAWLAELELG